MSHLLFLFMCDLTLAKGKMKSCSYGLLPDIALEVECVDPGQNCFRCILGMKSKSVKEK